MLYRPLVPAASPPCTGHVAPREITGRNLAHAKRTPTERALLASDLASGRAVLIAPTLRQAAMLTGANGSYAQAAMKLDAGERRSVANGWRPLITQHAQRALPPGAL
jgi:hypothetical protein